MDSILILMQIEVKKENVPFFVVPVFRKNFPPKFFPFQKIVFLCKSFVCVEKDVYLNQFCIK